MAADINDKLKKYKSRFSTTLSTGIGTGTSDTLTPATVTGLPTDTAVTLFIDRVDSTGTKTPSKLEAIKGVISGGNLTSYVRAVEGTEQAHSGGAVVEMVWNAADWNDMVNWGLEEHNQDGTHDTTKVVTPTDTQVLTNKTLTSPVLTTPKITTSINDANGNEVIKTPATTSAVNEVTVTNSATGNAVQVSATGDDTNIDLKLVPKGTGAILDKNAEALSPNYSMARQAVINGNMMIAQRGASFTNPANGDYTLDRYKVIISNDGGTPPTIIHSQQTQTAGDLLGSYNFYRVNTNGAGSGYGANAYYGVVQRVEHGTRFLAGLNKKVTLSFYARSSIANKKLGVFLSQNYGSGGSPSAEETIAGTTFTLTSSWVKCSYTFTTNTIAGKTFGTANDDYLQFWFLGVIGSSLSAARNGTTIASWEGSGNIDIAQVQLCAGDVALPFQPKSFEEELRACMRYYEKSYDYATAVGTASAPGYLFFQGYAAVANGSVYGYIPFKVKKRAPLPTIVYRGFAGGTAVCSNAGAGTDLAANSAANYSSSYSECGVAVYNNSGGNITPTSGGFILHYTCESEL